MSDYQPVTIFIERLAKLDVGERARLKRSAGQSIAEAREVSFFYRLLPNGVPEYKESVYFLVATFYPILENIDKKENFGNALRHVRTEQNKNGLDKRVQVLLDSDESQLPFRLRQAVHLLQAQRISVNWKNMLEDLLKWDSPSRFVQRSWARSYFAD